MTWKWQTSRFSSEDHLEMVETFACPVRLIHAARWGIRNGILVGGHGPNHDWCGISSLSDTTSRPNLVHPSQSLPSRAMSNLLFYICPSQDLWNPLGPDAAVSSNFQLRGSGSWELSPQQLEPSYQQVSRSLPKNRIPLKLSGLSSFSHQDNYFGYIDVYPTFGQINGIVFICFYDHLSPMITPWHEHFFSLVPPLYIKFNRYLLVVSTPSKNMKVRLDHHPNYWGKQKNVPHHQPVKLILNID